MIEKLSKKLALRQSTFSNLWHSNSSAFRVCKF